MAKRKPDSVPNEESDLLLIRPLGAGQEVGRSCIMLEFKGEEEIDKFISHFTIFCEFQNEKSCLIVEFTRVCREWTHFLSWISSKLTRLICSSSHSKYLFFSIDFSQFPLTFSVSIWIIAELFRGSFRKRASRAAAS